MIGRALGLGILLRFRDDATRGLTLADSKVRQLTRGVDKATAKWSGFAKQVRTGAALMGAGALLLGSLVYGVRESMKFRNAMGEVHTMLSGTKVGLSSLSSEISSISASMGLAAGDLAGAEYQILSASVPVEKSIGFLKTSAKAAVAGITETKIAADGLSSVVNAYSMDAERAAALSDEFFTAVKLGKTTFPELAASIGRVAPTAAKLNVSTKELLGSIASITKQGIATSETVTGIKAALANIMRPTKRARDAARNLGLEFNSFALRRKGLAGFMKDLQKAAGGNVAILGEMFESTEALNVVLALMAKNGEDFAGSLFAMQNAAGATDEAFKKIAQTPGHKLRVFQQTIIKAARDIGGVFVPVLGYLAQGLTFVFRLFDRLPKPLKAGVGLFIGLSGAVLVGGGALLTLSGSLGMLSMMLRTSAAAAGLHTKSQGLLSLAWKMTKMQIKGVIGTLKSFWGHVGKATFSVLQFGKSLMVSAAKGLKSFALGAYQAGKSVVVFALNLVKTGAVAVWNFATSLVTGAVSAIGSFVAAMPAAIASVWVFTAALLANPITWVVLGVVALIAGLVLLVKHWGKVKAAIGSVFSWIVSAGKKVWAWFDTTGGKIFLLMSPIGMVIFAIKNFGKVWDWLKEKVGVALGWISANVQKIPIVGMFIQIFGTLKRLFSGKIDMSQAGRALMKTFVAGIKSVAMAPFRAVKWVLGKLRKLLPFSNAPEGPLSNLLQAGQAFVKTFSAGLKKASPGLYSIVSSVFGKLRGLLGKAWAGVKWAFPGLAKAAGLAFDTGKALLTGRPVLRGAAIAEGSRIPAMEPRAVPVRRPSATPLREVIREEAGQAIPAAVREKIVEKTREMLKSITLPITVLLDGRVLYEAMMEYSEDETTREWKQAPSVANAYGVR